MYTDITLQEISSAVVMCNNGEVITSYSSHKQSINWYSPLGYKQVIIQVHSYDIFVINTCPQLRLGLVLITKTSYSYWVITITYSNIHSC